MPIRRGRQWAHSISWKILRFMGMVTHLTSVTCNSKARDMSASGSFTSCQLLGSLRTTLRPHTTGRAADVATVDETELPEVAW